MRVEVSSATADDDRWFPVLDLILLLVEQRRHAIDALATTTLLRSRWAKARGTRVREVLLGQAKAAANDADANRSVLRIDESCALRGEWDGANATTLRPLQALQMLLVPFQLVVENEENDGAFLLWMARAVGYTKLVDAYHAGRLQFRHAGGKGLISASLRVFLQGVWGSPDGKRSRDLGMWLGVMLDNDATHPADDPNRQLLDDLVGRVLFTHQLARRSIESYVPSSHLKRYLGSSSGNMRVDALFRLAPEQRCHFNVKKGFSFRDNPAPSKAEFSAAATVAAEVKTLYGSVAEPDWSRLCAGFGSKVSTIFTAQTFRCSPSEGLGDQVAEAEILQLAKRIYGAL